MKEYKPIPRSRQKTRVCPLKVETWQPPSDGTLEKRQPEEKQEG
jgi:hypothetical protein